MSLFAMTASIEITRSWEWSCASSSAAPFNYKLSIGCVNYWTRLWLSHIHCYILSFRLSLVCTYIFETKKKVAKITLTHLASPRRRAHLHHHREILIAARSDYSLSTTQHNNPIMIKRTNEVLHSKPNRSIYYLVYQTTGFR